MFFTLITLISVRMVEIELLVDNQELLVLGKTINVFSLITKYILVSIIYHFYLVNKILILVVGFKIITNVVIIMIRFINVLVQLMK